MKHQLSIYVGLLCLLCSFSVLQQGNGIELLRKAQNKFIEVQEVSLSYTISSSCEDRNGVNQGEKRSGKYIKNGKDLFLSNQSLVTIIQGDYMINIDHSSKQIAVQKRVEIPQLTELYDFIQKDSAQFDFNLRKLSGGRNQISISPKNSEGQYAYLHSCTFELNPNGWLTSVSMKLNKKAQGDGVRPCSSMSVQYQNIRTKGVDSGELNISKYVTIKGKQVSLKPKFKSYSLTSSLNIEMP